MKRRGAALNEGKTMKKLGQLNASSLKTGDIIRLSGFETEIVDVSRNGSIVSIETKMFEAVEFYAWEKVSLFH